MDLGTITSTLASGSPIGLIAGFIGRLIPQGVKYFDDKDQRAHERELIQLNTELEKVRATTQVQIEQVKGDEIVRDDAIKAQGQLTGVKIVDALNNFVRPYYAYAFSFLYFIAKWQLYNKGELIYSPEDITLFYATVSFWLCDRSIVKGYAK